MKRCSDKGVGLFSFSFTLSFRLPLDDLIVIDGGKSEGEHLIYLSVFIAMLLFTLAPEGLINEALIEYYGSPNMLITDLITVKLRYAKSFKNS